MNKTYQLALDCRAALIYRPDGRYDAFQIQDYEVAHIAATLGYARSEMEKERANQ